MYEINILPLNYPGSIRLFLLFNLSSNEYFYFVFDLAPPPGRVHPVPGGTNFMKSHRPGDLKDYLTLYKSNF